MCLKSTKIVVFQKFQLQDLKQRYSSYQTCFWWFWKPFCHQIFKNGRICKFHLFLTIFKKIAVDIRKWASGTRGMGQMESFSPHYNPTTWKKVLEEVSRESAKLLLQSILSKLIFCKPSYNLHLKISHIDMTLWQCLYFNTVQACRILVVFKAATWF